MGFSFKRIILLSAALGLVAATASADITSPHELIAASPGQPVYVPMTLQATGGEYIAGINGQINYDAAYFSAPEIQAGPNSSTYHVLAHEIAPGQVRFVLYSDPVQAVPVNAPLPTFYLKLTAADSLPKDGHTTVTYLNGPVDVNDPNKAGESSASDVLGNSLAGVAFSSVDVVLNRTAADNWMLYD